MRRHLLSVAMAVLVAGHSLAQVRPSAEDIGGAGCSPADRRQLPVAPSKLGCCRQLSLDRAPRWKWYGAAGGRCQSWLSVGLSVGTALGSVLLLLRANATAKFDNATRWTCRARRTVVRWCGVPTGAASVDAASELATSRMVLVRLRLHPAAGRAAGVFGGRWNYSRPASRWPGSERPRQSAKQSRRLRGWTCEGFSTVSPAMPGSTAGWRICCPASPVWVGAKRSGPEGRRVAQAT